MPPVSPGQPSSFGSVFADSPGLLRENGWTIQFNMATSSTTVNTMAICSGSAGGDVTQYQTQLDSLSKGDSLNIYGIQVTCGSGADPLVVALKTGAIGDDATNPTLMVASSNRNGPWFQHFELPIKVDGPETGSTDVYIKILRVGSTTANINQYNRVTLEVIPYRRSA